MILGGGVKAYVCVAPVDMRKSIDGLSQLVVSVFARDGVIQVAARRAGADPLGPPTGGWLWQLEGAVY